jgi:hypothetical protein
LTVLAAKRAAIRTAYPWVLAGLFSAASVAFNIAHAPDRPVAQLVFAMAPVALVLTTHLLMQQVGWRHRRTGPDQPPAPVAPVGVDADPRPLPTDTLAGVSANASRTPGSGSDRAGPTPDLPLGIAGRWPDTTGPDVDNQTAMSGPELDLQARGRQIYEEHRAAGRPVSGAVLARQLGTSERHGRRLLAEFRAKDEGSARRNGDGAAQHKQAGPMPT